MRRFLRTRPVIGGFVILIVGLAYAVEGGFLASVGGDWVYLAIGIGYVVVGILLLLGMRLALWVNAAIFLATIIWTVFEVKFGPYAVFGWLPRTDVAIVICWYLMLPWVWQKLGRGVRSLNATEKRGWPDRESAIAAFVPGVVAVLLFVTGAVVVVVMPFSISPMQNEQVASTSFLPNFGIKPGNWRYYGRTPGGSRYSPLGQITPENVSKLKVAWTYRSGDMKYAGSGPGEFGDEATPIKVNHMVYTCTPNGWVIALDPVTGKQIWKFKPGYTSATTSLRACRSVSYYKAPPGYHAPDGSQKCEKRIFAPQPGPFIYALDAETGKPCRGFGDGHGRIDLRQHMGRVSLGALHRTSAPFVMDNKIYVGGSVTDNWMLGEPSGALRAFDAVTGKMVWHWDLGKKNPNGPLKPGETFTRYTPNSWGVITGDPKRGIVYFPLGNATPDYDLKHRRPFDKKYSGSTLALDADTGKELWHYQFAHTDVWDFDLPIGPSLVNWPDGHGGTIPALVQTTKFGQFYVLNRVTGKPIMPIKEKPVTRGPKDGPLYSMLSKTQPFSTGMPAVTPEQIEEADMWGITPFDQMWCRMKFDTSYYGGYYTPPTTQGSIMYPTFDGVVDWYGASFTPNGKLVVMANYIPYVAKLIPRKKAVKENLVPKAKRTKPLPSYGLPAPAQAGDAYGLPAAQLANAAVTPMYYTPFAISIGPMLSPIGIPCIDPPFSTLNMINLNTQKLEWSIPLGSTYYTQVFHIDYKLRKMNIPTNLPLPTGVYGFGAAALTSTHLAFIAAVTDRKMRAVDVQTGDVLWSADLPVSATATPSIYRGNNGCEYVVISAGGHDGMYTKYGDYTIAYALPKCIHSGA